MGIVSSDKLIDFDFIHSGTPFIVLSNDPIIQTNGLDYLNQFDLISIVQLYNLELEFTFLNSISSDVDKDLLISNRSTIGVDIDFLISNKLFLYNEVEKNFISKNKLLSFLSDEYTGFYFSKIHGV